MMVFHEWWESDMSDLDSIVAYLLKWPPPPRWMAWMARALLELDVWADDLSGSDFDYSKHFDQLSRLGFVGVDDYLRDLGDDTRLGKGG